MVDAIGTSLRFLGLHALFLNSLKVVRPHVSSACFMLRERSRSWLCPDQVLHFLLCFVLISEIEFLPCVNLLGRRFGYTLVVDLRGMVKVDAVVVKRIVKAVDNPAGYT